MIYIKADYVPQTLMNSLLRYMTYDNALAITTSLQTGIRIGDILALTPDNLKDGYIYFKASKTGKEGKIKVSADLYRRLQRNGDKKFVFPGRKNGKHRTRQAVWTDVKKAARHVGISVENVNNFNISPHSARKIKAVEEYRKHGLAATQRLLQHDDVGTTLIYALADKLTENEEVPIGTSSLDTDELAEKIARRVVELLAERLEI